MSKPMTRISNTDGTVIDREMNDTEFAIYLHDIANENAKLQGGN